MTTGKKLRLQRLFHTDSERALVIPLDHTLSMGPVAGLDDVPAMVRIVAEGGATGVILHRGSLAHLVASGFQAVLRRVAVIVHLTGATAMSPEPARQRLLCDVEEAVRYGADAVSVQVNFGCRHEPEMLTGLARVIRHAERLAIPVLAMAYVRDDAAVVTAEPTRVLHATRAVAEVGADVVKIPFPGTEALVRAGRMVPIPLLVAGGARESEEECLAMCAASLRAGARGLCIGRNVFQSPRPAATLARLARLVHAESQNGVGIRTASAHVR